VKSEEQAVMSSTNTQLSERTGLKWVSRVSKILCSLYLNDHSDEFKFAMVCSWRPITRPPCSSISNTFLFS
jgi:hypothetical protein